MCAANSIVSYNFVQSPIASAKPRNGHCSKHLGTDIPGVYAMKGRADPARNQHGQWQPWSLGSALFFEKKTGGAGDAFRSFRCFPHLSNPKIKKMAAVQIWEPLERPPKAHRALPANAPIPAK